MLAAAAEPRRLPKITIRGRSFLAITVRPESPLADWLEAFDAQLGAAGGLFTQRPLVIDLAAVALEGPEAAAILLEGLEARGLQIVGVEGAPRGLLAGSAWERLLPLSGARHAGRDDDSGAASPVPQAEGTSLLIDRPVRSGQSVCFEAGDVTVVGQIASGAEVIAGGSIHVYGALRGRAIAGLRQGAEARIFCRRMEAEMVGVDRLYRTAEHWGEGLHGGPVQVRCDRGALRLSRLD